jgi:peptidoglycan-N-acetylglucosamine deacetylase
MLNFRRTNILFFLLLIFYFEVHFFMHISYWWLAGLAFLYSVILYIGSSRINFNFYFEVFCKGDPAINGILLTFDDGPDPSVTPEVLDILKKHNVKAVFFLIGKKAEAYPELVRKIFSDGHVIGNHSFHHKNLFDLSSPYAMVKEIENTRKVIYDISGISVHWFRPPFGVTNPMLKRVLKLTKCFPVGWSIWSLDTMTKPPEKILKRLDKTGSGDIVLFHDTKKNTPMILERFIEMIRSKGLEIIEPEKFAGISPYIGNNGNI